MRAAKQGLTGVLSSMKKIGFATCSVMVSQPKETMHPTPTTKK
jgi:hypothetical protein